MAYRFGIAFLVEELLSRVIGRPPTPATVVPGGDTRIGPGSKRDAVGHLRTPWIFQKDVRLVHAIFECSPTPIVPWHRLRERKA